MFFKRKYYRSLIKKKEWTNQTISHMVYIAFFHETLHEKTSLSGGGFQYTITPSTAERTIRRIGESFFFPIFLYACMAPKSSAVISSA